jgi:hypothetical protein
MKEEELLGLLKENAYDLKQSRLRHADLKNQLIEADTRLIGLKLEKDRLTDQLRRLRNSSISTELDPNDAIDESFRQRFPDLLKKL